MRCLFIFLERTVALALRSETRKFLARNTRYIGVIDPCVVVH